MSAPQAGQKNHLKREIDGIAAPIPVRRFKEGGGTPNLLEKY